MYNPRFEKDVFKRDVRNNVKTLFRKEVEEATPQQLFQAVSYAVKEAIIDDWLATQKQYEKDDPKTVYYMSMEFLLGRALGNNLINMTAYKEVKEALEEMGIDLNVIEDQEPDPALGNGGLGRLAACFLDSLATLGYASYGCGIRYRYGMFKQKIRDGYQVEAPDNWLKDGNPFELRRPEYAKEVRFGGNIRVEYDETGKTHFVQENYESVMAIPYDYPIVGYGNHIVNTLRIWDAEAIVDFQLDSFDRGDYHKAVEQENLAKNIAFKVKKTRRPVFLEPMNPYERRIIHSALQNDPYVTTHSEGEEPNRKVVVTPRRKNERGGNEGGRREYRRSDRSEYTRRKEQATPAGVAAEEPQQPEAEN